MHWYEWTVSWQSLQYTQLLYKLNSEKKPAKITKLNCNANATFYLFIYRDIKIDPDRDIEIDI